jgi:hypothetical protein
LTLAGSYNDGYADDLSLVLSAPAVVSAQPVPTLIEWNLIALVGLLALVAGFSLRPGHTVRRR